MVEMKLMADQITKDNYDRKAHEYAKNSELEEFPTIVPGAPEWQAWERYFRDFLGFEPWAMKSVKLGQRQVMTVPTQWPEWFDSRFSTVAVA